MLKFDFEIYGVLMEVLFEILDVNFCKVISEW